MKWSPLCVFWQLIGAFKINNQAFWLLGHHEQCEKRFSIDIDFFGFLIIIPMAKSS